MYRRPKFLEVLHEIREEMSREADYDMDLFAEMVRNGGEDQRQREKGKTAEKKEQNFDDRKSAKTKDRNLIYGNRF